MSLTHYIAGIAAALLLTACASSRKTAATSTTPSATPHAARALAPQVNAHRVTATALTAKMNLRIEAAGKNVSIGGNFRVRRDDVIQLQLVFLGLKEVGRLELTRDTLLIIDRLNNQYLQARYADIPYLRRAGIDFYAFQSLFWGELFVPDGHGAAPEADAFTQDIEENSATLTHTSRELALRFLIDAVSTLLQSTRATSATNQQLGIEAAYSDWQAMAHGQFPARTTLTLATGTPTTYRATLQLSSLKENDKWEARTTVNQKKYRPVTVDHIMKQIMKLAQ